MLDLECRFARNAPGLDGADFQCKTNIPLIQHSHPRAQFTVGELSVEMVIGVAYDVDSRSCLFPQIGVGKEFSEAVSALVGRRHHLDLRPGRTSLSLQDK